MAWVQRPSGLIKTGEAQACLGETTLVKVENVSQKWIYMIDQVGSFTKYIAWLPVEICG